MGARNRGKALMSKTHEINTPYQSTKFLTLVFFVMWIGYHLATLSLSPLPWFDEVFYASISESFRYNGTLILSIAPDHLPGGEALSYGPVYFMLTAWVTDLIGFNIFSFRLANFAFGSAALVLFYQKFILNQARSATTLLCGAILFTDPLMHAGLHSGRMEGVAFFFFI